jgi:endonuclease G
MPPRKKSPAPTKKRSRPAAPKRKNTKANTSGFWVALIVGAFISFQIAIFSFNPHWIGIVQRYVSNWTILDGLSQFGQGTDSTVPRATGDVVTTDFPQCRQFFPDGQAPILIAGTASELRELCFSSFAILHSGVSKTPVFVVERLNRNTLAQAKGLKRTDKFYAEARLPRPERAELGDYSNSSYSRGHMAPAANMPSAESMAQSFSLANMVPQDQRHNSGAWNKIEEDTRKYVMRAQGDVFVFTGPIFGVQPATIGANQVHVPEVLFKLVYDAQTGRSWAHWQQNSPQQQSIKPISYAELVTRTGLHLLPGIEQ